MGELSIANLFAGNSGMTARIRSHFAHVKDVVEGVPTPLGAAATWPPSLKSVFGILLNSGCPMFLVWDYAPLPGPASERLLFYNEAYLSLLNETPPLNLSDRVNNRWAAAWDTIQADVEQVFTTGQALIREQEPVLPNPHGQGNKALYTWSYSAVWDEIGQIRGVFATGFQAVTTGWVTPDLVAERGQDEKELPCSHQPLQTPIDPVSLQDLEAALRESQARFTAFMRHSPTATWIADPDGRLLYLNPTYFQMFHFPQQDAVGKQIQEIYSEEVAQQFLENNRRVFQTGQVIETVETAPRPDGSRGSFLVYKFPIAQETGEILLGGVAVDITDRKQAEERLRQSEERLRIAQQAANAGVWDWDITTNQVTWSDEYYRLYGLDPTTQASYENWLRSIVESDRDRTDQAARDALKQQINLNVEFRVLHPTLGERWLTAIGQTFYDDSGQPIRMTGIALDITQRKQAEAEREQLLVQEQAIRAAALAAEQRAEFLAAASETLASSLDYEYTLNSVAQAVVPTLADWCAVDILNDDGTLERLATAHVDPAKVQWGLELHRRYPPDLTAPRGIAQVLRTGQSEYYPTISDDQIVAAARDDEHLRILREVGFSSVMLVPLNARGRTLGTLCFVAAESGRFYSPEDLSLAEELARRGAIALDNARLYQEAQQAQQAAERAADRTSRLQMVTAALSESLTPEQVAAVIVEQSLATLEATAALVVLLSPNRTELEIVKSVGYQADLVESWRRFSIDTDVPLAEAIRTGETVWVETILDRIVRYPHLAEIYNRYEFKAWIALPLVVEGKSIGGMLVSFTEFRSLNQEDRDFILALTQQCAQAIVRAQLYAAERQARAEAEQANRIKDEFLAVLSHELRSPLNPILGWSRLLQTRPFDQAGTKRALETIERNAKLQTQLIDDLLDVSRILRGKLVLAGCPTNLVNVIDAAFETVRLSAETKGIAIQKIVEGEVGLILGDAGRLQQVVWNLLSNAVKFTPEGGQIEIRLEQIDNQAQIQVIDTGKGINPEFLPHVFEYFRQEDGATTRRFGGLGLGLAIVRHLVELQGGTVQAASPGEGKGATFTVRLPLLKDTDAQSDTTDSLDPSFLIRQPLAKVQVLVVDDEPDSREFIAFVLEEAGAVVTAVSSAREALQAFEQTTPDVLVSDIGMPEMDGYMLIRQLRSLSSEPGQQRPAFSEAALPAIALTAYAGEVNQQQAFAAGFQCHLAKPIEPEALVSAIVQLTGERKNDKAGKPNFLYLYPSK